MLTVRSGSYKRKRPAKKARVPRTLAVKPADRIYRFTRTVSTNDGELNTTNIQLRTDALGHPRFYAAGAAVSGDNLQMVFSLSSFDIYLNGALTSTQNPPGYSEFTALFDEWCIEKVELFALPTFCTNDIATGTSAAQLPWIVYAEDNDDAADTPCRNLQQVAGLNTLNSQRSANSRSRCAFFTEARHGCVQVCDLVRIQPAIGTYLD